jgi:hypothetical protein
VLFLLFARGAPSSHRVGLTRQPEGAVNDPRRSADSIDAPHPGGSSPVDRGPIAPHSGHVMTLICVCSLPSTAISGLSCVSRRIASFIKPDILTHYLQGSLVALTMPSMWTILSKPHKKPAGRPWRLIR